MDTATAAVIANDFVNERNLRGYFERRLRSARPWLFGDDTSAFRAWQIAIRSALGKGSPGVYLVGSSMFGISLKPLAFGRPFREVGHSEGPSDVDIAVVDANLFTVAWNHIVDYSRFARAEIGHGRLPAQIQVVRNGIYWGHVTPRDVPSSSEIVGRVRTACAASERELSGHPATARIYRRFTDLVGYQTDGLSRTLRGIMRE